LGIGTVKNYFPHTDPDAGRKLEMLQELYGYWNEKINVISRKDLSNLYINHVLHSLSLLKVISFLPGEKVLDIGTGGGFPGIPLAIMNPGVEFILLDATGKKIKVVENISASLELGNVTAVHCRAEDFKGSVDYVVSRAVGLFTQLVRLSAGMLVPGVKTRDVHGLYSLKGGDLEKELEEWKEDVKIFRIGDFFSESWFQSKNIVFLPTAKMGPK
jgi:16S rRNA (guanine527-N7)-methyltransferase